VKFLQLNVLRIVWSVALCSSLANTLFASASGPLAYYTGAPNDLGTCNTDECHNSFSIDSGSAIFSITGPTVYTSGKTVKLTVSFSNSSGKRHGFEMTALDADGNRVGTFNKIGNTTQVIPPNDHRGLDQADKGKYIEHTFKGIKKKTWNLKWKAPDNTTGTVTFYAAGCEANGDGVATDDYIYTATTEITSTP
jgi:hypothetical protein